MGGSASYPLRGGAPAGASSIPCCRGAPRCTWRRAAAGALAAGFLCFSLSVSAAPEAEGEDAFAGMFDVVFNGSSDNKQTETLHTPQDATSRLVYVQPHSYVDWLSELEEEGRKATPSKSAAAARPKKRRATNTAAASAKKKTQQQLKADGDDDFFDFSADADDEADDSPAAAAPSPSRAAPAAAPAAAGTGGAGGRSAAAAGKKKVRRSKPAAAGNKQQSAKSSTAPKSSSSSSSDSSSSSSSKDTDEGVDGGNVAPASKKPTRKRPPTATAAAAKPAAAAAAPAKGGDEDGLEKDDDSGISSSSLDSLDDLFSDDSTSASDGEEEQKPKPKAAGAKRKRKTPAAAGAAAAAKTATSPSTKKDSEGEGDDAAAAPSPSKKQRKKARKAMKGEGSASTSASPEDAEEGSEFEGLGDLFGSNDDTEQIGGSTDDVGGEGGESDSSPLTFSVNANERESSKTIRRDDGFPRAQEAQLTTPINREKDPELAFRENQELAARREARRMKAMEMQQQETSIQSLYNRAQTVSPSFNYVGIGYDSVKGNPLGDPNFMGDPGLRSPIIRFTFVQDEEGVTSDLTELQPLGAYSRPFVACKQSENLSEVATISDYVRELEADAQLAGGDALGLYSFSASASYRDVAKKAVKRNSKTFLLKTYCLRYEAGLAQTESFNW
ncbi:hypothetical protein Emed_000763 [Eimeria media]